MEVEWHIQFRCVACGWVMFNRPNNHLLCGNPGCEHYKKLYHAPVTRFHVEPVEPVKQEPVAAEEAQGDRPA